ncbi:type II secretion system GspH family protein [bacterium]|jgi:prepilin-type N-terminal cleavage/methylation domain-containing protein|nr:type II secretion system GspH family protein [bacterium]
MMNKKAFTLVELVVVIAIISILSSFVFVQMKGAIEAASDAKKKAEVSVIKRALIVYGVEHGDTYPVEATPCTIGSCTILDIAMSEYLPDEISGTYVYESDTGSSFTVSSTLSSGYSYQYDSTTNAFINLQPVNGACGSSHGVNLSSIPTTNLCQDNSIPAIAGEGPWTWSCAGSNGGTTASCSTINIPVNGVCGSKNGKYANSTPTETQACETGTITDMAGSYSWTCAGSNGGTSSGTCATVAAAYTVVSFTTVGTSSWAVPTEVNSAEVLIVGGGGGGGVGRSDGYSGVKGGGGGAGGVLYGTLTGLTGSYDVTVGSGGASVSSSTIYTSATGKSGTNSSIGSFIAYGGGGGGVGGAASGNQAYTSGLDGGSGGGSGNNSYYGTAIGDATQTSQSPLIGYGNNGGITGGGGGGAGGVGGTGNWVGGVGMSFDITGSAVTYATGGGPAAAGANNTGNGGGVGSNIGYAGGSGIVVIRYITNY